MKLPEQESSDLNSIEIPLIISQIDIEKQKQKLRNYRESRVSKEVNRKM